MSKKNRQPSTFDQEMQNVEFKQAFELEYTKFVLQELLFAILEGDTKSVQALAIAAGLYRDII